MKGLSLLLTLLVLPAQAQQRWFFPAQAHGGMLVHDSAGFPSAFPSAMEWPLARQLGDGTFLSNYVDDDQGTTSVTDYMGGHDHLYDDHRGTDIAIYNFRLMDRGMYIVAPAAGTVLRTTIGFGDRNTTTPYPDGGNGIAVRHDDGSESYYWHIRTNSAMVEPGERFEAGQPLAFVGSSGWTPIPHLHFELSSARDPWQGSYNPAPSLWRDQPDYVGDAPLWVMDQGVFTLAAVGGSTNGITDKAVKERISEPALVGDSEAVLYAWVQAQGNVGDQFVVELVRPDGTVAVSDVQGVSRKTRYGWFAFELPLPGERDTGTWTMRTREDGRVLMESSFELGAETRYAPRFKPVAGRSVRLDQGTFSETLAAVPFNRSASYHLVNAPSNVMLDGSTVTIGGTSDQEFRSRFFQVVATDEHALTDTMWYHLIDPTKPLDPPAGATTTDRTHDLPQQLSLDAGFPNPAAGRYELTVSARQPSTARVAVFDLLGRRVHAFESSLASGPNSFAIGTAGWPGGTYLVRVQTADGSVSRLFSVLDQ
ncbi:MAG: peptidoglycan DD-metalloendopeptidase family protein [Rhodothermales bacterium]|nr:peptidoglycan DD-metalloendopeptidase family protein [Rhodothermales bacterium]MBO6778614.1 peptidoglycan DD-metalloendopeptidase family protein [Rhodothermales bacterium]